MADTFITSSMVLAEALDLFKNNLRFGNQVYREYSKEFTGTPKIGESFQIRNPWRFEVQDGPTINLTDTVDTTITMSITAHKVIPISILTRDKTMKVDEFKKRYLEDAMVKLANQVDSDLAGLYVDVGQAVGTAGTTPATFLTFGDAATKLDNQACPMAGRQAVLNPVATYTMADALKGIFNPSMVEGYIKTGQLTPLVGVGMLGSSQNIKAHTAGTGASYAVDGANQVAAANTDPKAGMNLLVKTGTGTLLKGDRLTIAGVNALNPVNYASTGQLQEFVVKADYAGGAGNVSIAPALVISGPTRNVTGAAADSAAITKTASHIANLVFCEKAFALATVPFELPETAPVKEQLSVDGIAMTLTGGWDVTNYREIYRLDILYGVKTLYPSWAVRVMG